MININTAREKALKAWEPILKITYDTVNNNLEILLRSRIANKKQILDIKKILNRYKKNKNVIFACYYKTTLIQLRYNKPININVISAIKPIKIYEID